MRLEALSRLIDAADFLSFREIALKTMSHLGYSQPSLTDGWSDGGTDIRVSTLPPHPNPIAVQITVEKDWKGKLKGDARKVKDTLKLKDLIFVTSRRIPEAEFALTTSEILRDIGVRVTRLDNQSIASIFFDKSEVGVILNILGITSHTVTTKLDNIADAARLDAAYSFAIFGEEPEIFRERVVDSTITAAVARYDRPLTK